MDEEVNDVSVVESEFVEDDEMMRSMLVAV